MARPFKEINFEEFKKLCGLHAHTAGASCLELSKVLRRYLLSRLAREIMTAI